MRGGELQSYHNQSNRELLLVKAVPFPLSRLEENPESEGSTEWGFLNTTIPQQNDTAQSLPSIKPSPHDEVGSYSIATIF